MGEKKEVTGCVHIHIENGDVTNIFMHLSGLPENGVVHLVSEEVLSEEQFVESHPQDKDEIQMKPMKKIYDLGNDSIHIE